MSDDSQTPLDAELRRQLAKAKSGQVLQAVYTLRTPAGKKFLDAAETRSLVDRVLKAAQKKCGAAAAQINVFANLQSFALSAPKELIEAVSRAAEIASATANEQPESLLIEPVDPPAGKRAAEPDSKSSSSAKKKDGGGKRKQSSE